MLWSAIADSLSEKAIKRIENRLSEGGLSESQALRLLRYFRDIGRADKAQWALDQVLLNNNLRTQRIVEYAVQHFLHDRAYDNAYRYSKELCYYHDRYGGSLFQLSRLAILSSQYRLAQTWLQEYRAHNSDDANIAQYWLSICFLRQRYFRRALSSLTASNSPLGEADMRNWLSAVVGGETQVRDPSWSGRRSRTIERFDKLKWKELIVEAPLAFQAENMRQIDDWINRAVYVPDERLYGEADRWQIPTVFERIRQGDCEDFALWVWAQLMRMNIDARFMLGGLFSDDLNHAWVCIYGRGGVEIFECTPSRFNVPIRAENAPEYRPILSIDKSLTWYDHI